MEVFAESPEVWIALLAARSVPRPGPEFRRRTRLPCVYHGRYLEFASLEDLTGVDIEAEPWSALSSPGPRLLALDSPRPDFSKIALTPQNWSQKAPGRTSRQTRLRPGRKSSEGSRGDVSLCVRLKPGCEEEIAYVEGDKVRLKPSEKGLLSFLGDDAGASRGAGKADFADWHVCCDHTFGTTSHQEEIFETAVAPIVDAVANGYNGAVIAYGQTGAGKTYTMIGPKGPCRGVAPRAVAGIFAGLRKASWRIEVSVLEVYNEKVRDLLAPGSTISTVEVHEVREREGLLSFRCPDAITWSAKTPEEAMAALTEGCRRREVARTDMPQPHARSVAPRACYFAVPTGLVALLISYSEAWIDPDFRENSGIAEAQHSQLWQAATGVLFSLLIFRINRAMARFWEGTGLLHQMRGEWFDSVSCCVTFSRAGMRAKRDETLAFRHTIVRLMSLCHGSALKEIGGVDANDCETIDPQGLDNPTLLHLQTCSGHGFNRVEVMLHLIQSLITQSCDDGVICVPAPIISRVYQTLSRGFVNLLNAKKIADTRFPFPFAQLISLLLFLNIVLTPVLITSVFTKPVWCVVFSFLPVFGMSCLNFIGVELENPFGQDDNDLPLDHFQDEMNNCLLMLLHDSADLLPDVDSTRCMVDVDEIRSIMMPHHDQEASPSKAAHRPVRKTLAGASPAASPVEPEDDSSLQEGGFLGAVPPLPRIHGSESGAKDTLAVPSPSANLANAPRVTRIGSDQSLSLSAKEKAEVKSEGKLKTEEQLKTEAMLQGLERMVGNLQSIKTAVEEQAKKVTESSQAMTEFCVHLDSMLHSNHKPGERVRPSVRRKNWECSMMRCM
ncbi:unnamed protein product [Effrenium voratum]|uniref:Kinesin motor domain-containing protein n=1 Tax=Effrenium voratum TaxID=2562239 RepID=A0AA36IMR2_9DINO|nr:unnamed protein product [Effrenium voratum]